MTRAEVTAHVGEHGDRLRRMGVASLYLFGSTARNEATDSSDVDLLIEFDRGVGLLTFYRVQEFLESILGTEDIHLLMRRSVLDEMRDQIYAEAVPCLERTGSHSSGT